ncbi:MAG: class I SAM-dependent methyltransferase [Dehalococcoidia bacterium]|jgi:SAM-dependent methyltransferase|nr:class I SAM-dependent methyltransferase [Dehalococcoidia bacterium]
MSEEQGTSFYAMGGFWDRWETLTAPVTGELLADARLVAGERVVDIGCGAGLATFASAEAVGGEGRVVAFDLSAETLEIVRQRAAERGVTNIDTVAGDMERDDIEGAPFDVALNQFGLTYAKDLGATFSRIRGQLEPGGRCVFAAWVERERLPLLPGPLMARYGDGLVDQDPFAMADTAMTLGLLADAGFESSSVRTVELTNVVPLEAIFQEAMVKQLGLDEAGSSEVRDEVMGRIAAYEVEGGYAAPLVFHVFSAVNPG